MKKYLAISGKLRSGKDTFANILVKTINKYKLQNKTVKLRTVIKVAFADQIKVIAKNMFPKISNDNLYGPSENRSNIIDGCINSQTGNPLTVRDVLLSVGKYGRSCNENCWIDALFYKIDSDFSDTYYNDKDFKRDLIVIISDCRFKNEVKAIREKGGKIIRIIRPGLKYAINDESETSLDDFNKYDYVVKNISLEKLNKDAEKIVNRYIIE